jgi:hypothetical protein
MTIRRMMAEIDGDFAVFLIGMRLNRPWRVDRWGPLALAMVRMLGDLRKGSEPGFLGAVLGLPVSVVYWRSYEELEAWALKPRGSHARAMAAFAQSGVEGRGDIGFWHETYLVRQGDYDAVYSGMPPFGLGAASRLVPVTAERASARQRLRRKSTAA